MANPSSKNPVAGDFFMALGLLAGAIVGMFRGQSSLYMIAGLLIGSAIALTIWLVDRSKR